MELSALGAKGICFCYSPQFIHVIPFLAKGSSDNTPGGLLSRTVRCTGPGIEPVPPQGQAGSLVHRATAGSPAVALK